MTTTGPISLAEVLDLAHDLVCTLDLAGLPVGSIVVDAYGDGALSVMVVEPVDVAELLGGLEQVDYELDGLRRHYFIGPWRGISLRVSCARGETRARQ